MDGKVKTRVTAAVPNSLGRQIGILPVGNPPVRPRRPKPSTSYILPGSGRSKYSPPSPHSSRSQGSGVRDPTPPGANCDPSVEEDGVKLVNIPTNRAASGQRRPISGPKQRLSSGSSQGRNASASSQRGTPNDLDDDEIFHPYKTISQQEILDANNETDPEKIYEINLYSSDLTKINNLQQFKKLRVLDLSCNFIPKIENLNENVDIRELKLYGNRIHHIENLTRSIVMLMCSYNVVMD